MQMNIQLAKTIGSATLLMLLLSTQSQAVETSTGVDTSGWLCNFCNYQQGWFGSLDIGPGYASDDNLKFADYRGIDDEGGYISINGELHYLNEDGRYFDLYTRNLGINSRQLEMRGGRQGLFEIHMAYREIPKYRGFGTQTPFQGGGSNQLVLPIDWVRARTTDGLSALGQSLNTATLETKRKIFEAGLNLKLPGKWRYGLDFQHTEKRGTRAFGAGVFTSQAVHFPAPVDFSTNRFETELEFSGKRARLRLGFSSSKFDNRYASVTWQNPFRPLGNTAVLRAALEPDSKFHQFNLTGSFRPTKKVRLNVQGSIGRITQNDAFLPYSINPDFVDLQLPRLSLGGKLDTSTINLATRLTARLSPKLNLRLRMKLNDRDNRTPVDLYTPVITDLELRPETPNRPYSFKRNQYWAELSYRAHASVGINAGVKQKNFKRTLQSVRETRDSTWWGEINIDHWSAAQLRLKLETSTRDMSPYRQVSDPGLQENVLMRKFHLADRQRDRAMIELDLSPADRLSASLSYFISEDSFRQSILGLMESRENSFSLDLSFALKANLSLHAFATRDNYDSDISGAANPTATAWVANTKDRFTTLGFGLSGKLSDRLDIRVDYVSSDSRGRITTDSGAGEAPFPDLTADLRDASIRLNYRASPHWGFSLQSEHEHYSSSDWQIDALGNDGISAILTLGPQSPNYSITVLRLLANYSF